MLNTIHASDTSSVVLTCSNSDVSSSVMVACFRDGGCTSSEMGAAQTGGSIHLVGRCTAPVHASASRQGPWQQMLATGRRRPRHVSKILLRVLRRLDTHPGRVVDDLGDADAQRHGAEDEHDHRHDQVTKGAILQPAQTLRNNKDVTKRAKDDGKDADRQQVCTCTGSLE